MMKSISRGILTGLVLITVSIQAHAFRCGTKIVEIGDRKHRVFNLCGEPSFVDGYDRAVGVYPFQIQHIEVWTYNFGRNRFMQELVFENGVLQRINTLDYGY